MSHEYDYPDDTPTREEMEQSDADHDPPECVCEDASKGLYNPDCYWHGTDGVEIGTGEHECNDCGIMIPMHRPICTLCERWYEERGINPPGIRTSSSAGEPGGR